MSLRVAHQAGHRGDDDYGGGAWGEAVLLGGLEEGQEGYGGEIDAGDVCVED